jgi:hypothetical protein
MLAKNIKTRKRSSKFKRVIVQVSDNVYEHLKQNFNLNGRFKTCESFIDHFDIVYFDFLNSSDFNEIDKLSVELRLHQKRKINIHDSENNLHAFFSPKYLSMKFLVSEKKDTCKHSDFLACF